MLHQNDRTQTEASPLDQGETESGRARRRLLVEKTSNLQLGAQEIFNV